MTPQPPADQEQPDRPAARQRFRQIQVSDTERGRLKQRLEHDFLSARSDHDARISRFRRYYRMWRGLNQTRGTREDGQDLQIPMLKWTAFGAWARIMQALLGDDAEIVARPTAPSDETDAVKAGHYLTWRFYEYMRAITELAAFVFRAVLFGRAHAEIIYEQEYYFERDEETGDDKEVLSYDGPKLRALWPSQFITPAQDNVNTPDDFEWVIRRDRITPQQLLDGAERGKFQGIEENWSAIIAAAQARQERDYWWDDEKIDLDEAEGVDHVNTLGNRDSLEIWRWYGKWRFPKGNRDSKPENIKYRERQSEALVSYLPKVGIVVGIQDLRDIYPRMKKRNPFVSLATVKDGSYWPPGLGELCEDLQNESSINHALFRRAGMFSVGPIIFYKPGSGFDPEVFEYRANMAVPSEDPNGVKVVSMNANLDYVNQMREALKSINELVTGVSDQSLGRASDRPNAPQTASGQAMLLNEGNTRASLDMTMLREDLSQVIGYVWALDREYADEKVFFRVTESDAVGYDVNKGFGTMTAEEREHPYSFDVKFATSIWSREAKKQYLLQLYSLSMQNPIVQTNPLALWVILNRVWEAFGEANFRDVIPEPPEPERPKVPKDEWVLMMKGDEVQVSPLDDDQQHLLDHRRRLEQEINEPEERQDPELQKLAWKHIIEHEQQIRQKQILQNIATAAVQALQAQGVNTQPQAFPAPAPPAPAAGVAPPAAGSPVAPGPTGNVQPANQAAMTGATQ